LACHPQLARVLQDLYNVCIKTVLFYFYFSFILVLLQLCTSTTQWSCKPGACPDFNDDDNADANDDDKDDDDDADHNDCNRCFCTQNTTSCNAVAYTSSE